jgi:hypothetical protein
MRLGGWGSSLPREREREREREIRIFDGKDELENLINILLQMEISKWTEEYNKGK